ncbi:MAG: stage II sporulation protein M [Thaumarchaeota archaeon]|nr:stage II sporulation protein M [Nitrososphaerota archaeon]
MNKRTLLFFVFMAVFVAIFTIGSKMQVDEDEVQTFLEKFNNLVDSLRKGNFSLEIFSHNARIALPMFLLGVGV